MNTQAGQETIEAVIQQRDALQRMLTEALFALDSSNHDAKANARRDGQFFMQWLGGGSLDEVWGRIRSVHETERVGSVWSEVEALEAKAMRGGRAAVQSAASAEGDL